MLSTKIHLVGLGVSVAIDLLEDWTDVLNKSKTAEGQTTFSKLANLRAPV